MFVMDERKPRKPEPFTFGDLRTGDWFESEEGTLYLKIEAFENDWNAINAIQIADGSTEWFEDDEKVAFYSGTVTISPDMFLKEKPVMS